MLTVKDRIAAYQLRSRENSGKIGEIWITNPDYIKRVRSETNTQERRKAKRLKRNEFPPQINIAKANRFYEDIKKMLKLLYAERNYLNASDNNDNDDISGKLKIVNAKIAELEADKSLVEQDVLPLKKYRSR